LRRAVAAEELARQRAASASESARRYRQGSYVSDMLLAHSALQGNNPGRGGDLLGNYLPREAEEDIRGLGWRLPWNETKPQSLKTFEHKALVSCVATSPDGKMAATSSHDEKVRVWSLESGRLLAMFPWRSSDDVDALGQIAFSPNGKWLAMGRGGRIE